MMGLDYVAIRYAMDHLEDEAKYIHERIENIRQNVCDHPEYRIAVYTPDLNLTNYPSRVCNICDQVMQGITRNELEKYNEDNSTNYNW